MVVAIVLLVCQMILELGLAISISLKVFMFMRAFVGHSDRGDGKLIKDEHHAI